MNNIVSFIENNSKQVMDVRSLHVEPFKNFEVVLHKPGCGITQILTALSVRDIFMNRDKSINEFRVIIFDGIGNVKDKIDYIYSDNIKKYISIMGVPNPFDLSLISSDIKEVVVVTFGFNLFEKLPNDCIIPDSIRSIYTASQIKA